jgi:undecaprenyl-diphosphatase
MLENIDYSIFKAINDWAGKSEWLDKLGFFLADTLGYILVFIAVVWLLKKLLNIKKEFPINADFWRVIRVLVATLASSLILSRVIITEAIRYFYHRPRPFLAHNIVALINHSDSGSFPSGHMTLFFALSAVIYCYNRKLGWFFFIASMIMGVARIFCGVHYPLDIIGGAMVGIASTWIVYKLLNKQISGF